MNLKTYLRSLRFGFYPYIYLPLILWDEFGLLLTAFVWELFRSCLRVMQQLIIIPIFGLLGLVRAASFNSGGKD